jgi:hypothetical protein
MDTRQHNKFDKLNFRLERMQAARVNWENVWQRVAELADPKNASYTIEYGKGEFNKGGRKTDSTLALAVPKWANAIDGLTTPKTQKWHGLTVSDEYLDEKYRGYLEAVRDRLFAVRYGSGSSFSTAYNEDLRNIGYYGNGPFSVMEEPGRGIIYKAWPVKEFFVAENAYGEMDVFFRKFILDTRQALQEFGENAPQEIKVCNDLHKEWTFLHAVYPNADYDPGRIDGPHKKFASDYLCLTTKTLISEGGYDICPFFYPRYDVLPSLQDPYGYSPTMLLMPEVKQLMAMGRSNIRVAQRQSDPTWLASNEDIINVAKVGQPNAIIPGGVDANGRPLVQAVQMPNTLPFSLEMIQDLRNVIREGFDLNLFNVLVNKPDMTATEVLQRAQETATLLSPTTSRIEKELLSGVIAKELEICERAGQLGQMPPELAEALAAGQATLQIKYESPIRRAQEAEEGKAILQTLEVAGALQNFDPTIKNQINAPRALKKIAQVYGAPVEIFNSDEEKEQADMNDAQLAQAQQMLQAAPVISQSAKNMAEAQEKTGAQFR